MSRAKCGENGFTLIEVMTVLAILGGIIALASPYLSNSNSKTKAFLRHFVVMSRDLHTRAKLQGAVYRIVIDLKTSAASVSGQPPVQQWWVERANGKAILKAEEEADAMKPPEIGKDKVEDPRGFAIDPAYSKGPQDLPPGLRFEKIELTRLKSPITEGKAFIHYLPEGLVDEAAIHIKGKGNLVWTLSIHPLTGKAELLSKTVSLQDMRSQ
jgi:general secretion pathway protein H